ncbi:MAG: GNAT family N-acetyltransferase [bacterium]|nr:GNAT family N-acetyltransferase [bacterium]
MSTTDIVKLHRAHFDRFIELVYALADYEKLDRPSADAVQRLRDDAFGEFPRFEAFLAFHEGSAVGYAIVLEMYSSFLAKPTIYLEDLFVLESARGKGIGSTLFNHVRSIGAARDCGRMEWQVLDWNEPAIEFYKRKEGEHLKAWHTYRITY